MNMTEFLPDEGVDSRKLHSHHRNANSVNNTLDTVKKLEYLMEKINEPGKKHSETCYKDLYDKKFGNDFNVKHSVV